MSRKNNRSKLPEKKASKLAAALHELPNTGSNGFEGLVSRLLGELAGCRFLLAKSGSQFGRDGQSLHLQSGSIKFECKNYGKTDLNERLLLGEFEQVARDEGYVDLWLLVVSNEAMAQDFEGLERKAIKECIDFLILDSTEDGSGDLDMLCAKYPEIVTEFISKSAATAQCIAAANAEMKKISSTSNFSMRVENLRQKLLKPSLGWPNWALASKEKWIQYVLDKDSSKARFKQFIDLISSGNHIIHRESISNDIQEWFSKWKDSKNPLFIVGEEGVGKTWAIANWLTDSINSNDKQIPPIVFVSSTDTRGNGSLEELVVATLTEDYGDLNWKKRLNRWQQSQPTEIDGPIAIVVLDGLNERQTVEFWRNVLATNSSWKNSVAIACTLRTSYWERYFKPISRLKASICEVRDYDDTELAKALALRNHKLQDFPMDLHNLIAKPRYLDLAMTYRDELMRSGDFTVARLIYLDWKDRYNRKNHCSLADDEFNDLLKSFGNQFLKGQDSWNEEEIGKKLALRECASRAFQELSTGGVLEKGTIGWSVNKNSLALGLAMLLCEQLIGEIEDSRVQEAIEMWMGATPAGDIQSEVLELAALHSIMKNHSSAVRSGLFAAWLNTQNPASNLHDAVIKRFSAYLPDNAQTYFQLAERVWSKHFRNSCAEEILIRGYIRWAHESEDVKAELAEWLDRWLGMVSVEGPLALRSSNASDSNLNEKMKKQLRAVFGSELTPESQANIDGHTLTLIDDDGLVRLSFVALAVISTFKTASSFLHELVTGLMADALFGDTLHYREKGELFIWILRSSACDLTNSVMHLVEQHKNSRSQITKRAIRELLIATGLRRCWKLANEPSFQLTGDADKELHITGVEALESHMPFLQSDLEAYPRSASFNPRIFLSRGDEYFYKTSFQTEGNIAELLMPIFEQERIDWKDNVFTPEEGFVRNHERGLARYCSKMLCDMMRDISQKVSERISTYLGNQTINFHKLPRFRPYKIDLIMTQKERECWKKTSDTICSDFQERNFQFQHLESTIFRACLPLWTGSEQLAKFSARGGYEYDLVSFEHLFLEDENLQFPDPKTVEDWTRLILFLKSSKQFVLTKEQIKSALTFEGEGFRGLVFSYILLSGDSKLIEWWITECDWKWEVDCNFREEECAAALLIEYGTHLSLDELLVRIPATRRGDAIARRNVDQKELVEYGKWVDDSLNAMLSFEIPEEFPPFEITYYECLPSPSAPVSLKHSEEFGATLCVNNM